MHNVIHTPCGKLAFRSITYREDGDIIYAHEVRLLDGSTPSVGDTIKSGCGCDNPNPFFKVVKEEDTEITKLLQKRVST